MKAINSKKAPAALGPYSHAVYKNETLYVSGQLGIDPQTGRLASTFEGQAKLVFSHLADILEAGGMTFDNVVKVTIYVDNLDNFPTLNSIYGSYFKKPYPARETVQAAKLPAGGAVEISLIAVK